MNDIENVKKIVKQFKDHDVIGKLKEVINDDEDTLMHVACKDKKVEILQVLIDAGLNINAKNSVGAEFINQFSHIVWKDTFN